MVIDISWIGSVIVAGIIILIAVVGFKNTSGKGGKGGSGKDSNNSAS